MTRSLLTLTAAALLVAACGDSSTNDAPQADSPNESSAGVLPDFCSEVPRPAYGRFDKIETGDEWFQVYRVATGVLAIHEPFQWQETISYLIEGGQRTLLFDTGNGIGDFPAVIAKLTDKPVIVLNSHSHSDHVGANHAFAEVLGLNAGYSKQHRTGFRNALIAEELSAEARCVELPAGVDPAVHSIPAYEITRYVSDGELIDLGDRALEVLTIPGHTPDSLALIDRDAGLLWTGDSYYTGPIWLFAPETNLDDFRDSLDRLVAEIPNLTALMPAHNEPGVDPAALLDVQRVFEALLRGEASYTERDDDLVEYYLPEISGTSFLLSN